MAVKYLPDVQVVEVVSSNNPTVYARNAILAPTYYTTAITVATPYTMTALDFGSTILYKTFRVAVLYDQPMKIEFYCGSSSTLTSNKVLQTVTTTANVPQIIDFPVCGRYGGVKITNTGTATTAVQNAQWLAFSQ